MTTQITLKSRKTSTTLSLPVDKVEIKESKKGKDYAIANFWGTKIIININSIKKANTENKYYIEINNGFTYKKFGEDEEVDGIDLIAFHFANLELGKKAN